MSLFRQTHAKRKPTNTLTESCMTCATEKKNGGQVWKLNTLLFAAFCFPSSCFRVFVITHHHPSPWTWDDLFPDRCHLVVQAADHRNEKTRSIVYRHRKIHSRPRPESQNAWRKRWIRWYPLKTEVLIWFLWLLNTNNSKRIYGLWFRAWNIMPNAPNEWSLLETRYVRDR